MSILDEIVESKKEEIRKSKVLYSLDFFKANVVKKRGFFISEENKNIQIIAEIKRASPSKGDIAPKLNPCKKAIEYKRGGADAISVLTDSRYFKGSILDYEEVKNTVELPVLRKDFIIDEYQLYESAYYFADAVLLIARILTKDELDFLYAKCLELGIVPLVEIYSDDDLNKIKDIKNSFIGINNRNLSDFTTSLDNALVMAEKVEPSNHIISLSGVNSAQDALYLYKRGIRSFLIGEYLSKDKNASEKIEEIIKLCR